MTHFKELKFHYFRNYRLVEERRNEMSCPNVKLLEGFWSEVNFYTG